MVENINISNNSEIIFINKYIFNVVIKIYIVVIILGVGGNIFALVIFSRKKFQNTIFSTYFRFLCIFDTFAILFVIDDFILYQFDIYLKGLNLFSCRLVMYISYITPSVSSWMLVVISFDRLISIVKPSRYLIRKKLRFQFMICACVMVFNFIYYIQLLFSNIFHDFIDDTSNQTDIWCLVINENYNIIFDWIDLFYSTVIPFLLMLISTLLTLKSIFKSRKKLTISKNLVKDIKFAITSIFLNILFLILNFPLQCYYILTNITPINDRDVNQIVDSLLSQLFYLNYGVVFYLSIATNSIFRAEFFLILHNLKNIFRNK
jgi:hypothetical protein